MHEVESLQKTKERSTSRVFSSLQNQSAEEELAEATRLMAEQEEVNDGHRKKISEVLGNAEPLKVRICLDNSVPGGAYIKEF